MPAHPVVWDTRLPQAYACGPEQHNDDPDIYVSAHVGVGIIPLMCDVLCDAPIESICLPAQDSINRADMWYEVPELLKA